MSYDEMKAPSASLARIRKKNGDPYQNLANAIVCVAADDYRAALQRNDDVLLSDLRDFFGSEWCGILTAIDTNWLMDTLHKEYERTRQP